MILRILILLLLIPSLSHARRDHPEKWYQEKWCKEKNGITEHSLKDGTRVDCLTGQFAIEFDFANKWAESVAQSLHYAASTNRRPGIVLITEDKKDCKYKTRLRRLIYHYAINITIWSVGDGDCFDE